MGKTEGPSGTKVARRTKVPKKALLPPKQKRIKGTDVLLSDPFSQGTALRTAFPRDSICRLFLLAAHVTLILSAGTRSRTSRLFSPRHDSPENFLDITSASLSLKGFKPQIFFHRALSVRARPHFRLRVLHLLTFGPELFLLSVFWAPRYLI